MATVFYAQIDSRWKTVLLGYNTEQPWNIGNYGCLITAYGNMLNAVTDSGTYTPAWINAYMKDHDGFDPGGGIFRWSVALGLGYVDDHGTTTDIATVNAWLKDSANYAIICFNKGAHYSLANLVNTIIDSEDGKQKKLTTYTFTSARLYKAIPGKGAVAAPVVSIGDDDMPMTADEERTVLYEGILGRETNADDPALPTGRTWRQGMTQAVDEVTRQRKLAADTISSLQAQLTATLAKVPAPVDFKTTYIPEIRSRISARDGVQHAYDGSGPDVPAAAGVHFSQAGTFVASGVVLVRTKKSEDAGTWYGIPESVFDDGVSSRAVSPDALHVAASMILGVILKLDPFKNKK